MSNAIFPTLGGLDIKVKRTPLWSTEVLTSESGKEQRAAWWSTPRFKWSLGFNYLRQGLNGNEAKTLLDFFHQHRGQWDSFLFVDPYESSVAAKTFGTGTGSVAAYQLVDGSGLPVTDINGTPTIYRTDWQGTQQLYSTPRTNRIYFSQDFDNAGWTKVGTTVTANATTAPDGTSTADFLNEDSSTGLHFIYRTAGSPTVAGQGYGYSFYAKANGRTKVMLAMANMKPLNPGVVFDLATGKVTSNVGRMVNMGNGWWRCYAEGVADNNVDQNFQIRLVKDYTTDNYAGDGSSGIYLWGAQSEVNPMITPAFNISCEGDSITMQGQSGPWPTLLGINSPSSYTNTAVSGAKTANMVTRYDTYKTNARTHFAVLGGTNDFLQDVPVATTQANLSYMWADAKARGAIVVAMTIPPCQGYSALWTPTRQANLEYLNAWIRAQAAANGYVLVDTYAVLGDPGNPTYLNPAYDSGDHLHPNMAGGHAIRDAAGDAILIPATTPTSYIPTTPSPATVTDYSINSAGLVTLAANLATGATLTWTGGYYRRVRFDMDELDLERIFGGTASGGGQTWEGKTVKLISVK